MKKKKLYQILPCFIVGCCIVGMLAVGTRIFAKKVLIGKFGIENKITCMLADYNWGDRLERTVKEDIWAEQEKPGRLTQLETIYESAPKETSNASKQEEKRTSLPDRIKQAVTEQEDDIEKYCNDKFLFYTPMRKISSAFDRLTGWKLAYARNEGATYTLTTGFDYKAVNEKDMSAYAKELKEKADVAAEAGIGFLYVQYPYRVDEEESQVPWGADAYENENADELLALLEAESVDTLDLRSALKEKGWDNNTGFYETDGHWTTRSGFLSAGIVAEYLNENYGFSYADACFSEENYEVRSYGVNNPSVSEKVELFLPEMDTAFTVFDAYRSECYTGSFADACFDLTKADTKEYSTVLTAYSASRIRNSYLFEYQNEKKTDNAKTILVCSNSFSWHLIPYLALDTDRIDYVYNITTEQLSYYMETLSPDFVIILDRP